MTKFPLLLFVCLQATLFLFSNPAFADTTKIGPLEKGELRTGQGAIWHDPENRQSLESVTKTLEAGEFFALESAGSTGLKPGAFWTHFVLDNTTQFTRRLYIEYVDHQLIELRAHQRRVGADEPFRQIAELSLHRPFDLRPIPHNRFVFEVLLTPGQRHEFLVKMSSDEAGIVFPSMRIWDPKHKQESHAKETNAVAFLFGGFFLMSIFALVAGIATSEKTFYAYSLYSMSKIGVWATVLGYTHQYLLRDNFHWSYMSVSGAISITCGLIFARIFLQTKQSTPKLDLLLRFMIANALFLFICAVLKITAFAVISITLALLLYPVLLVVAFVRWRQGSIEAAVFGLAWALLVFGLVVQALRDLGVVQHTMLNYYWPPFASFSEMLTIMAAMGIKVQRLRTAKEKAEKLYLQQLEHSKSELEAQVLERTRELEEAKQFAEKEARTDELTGIHNRRSFLIESVNLVAIAQRKQQPTSLLLFDIDHFKAINDTYGHSVGDGALIAFCDAINGTIRVGDIFGRLGGEEFALLVYEAPQGVLKLAERLRKEVEDIKLDTDQGVLTFTTSVGITHLNEEDSIDTLIQEADVALYQAKNNGRNRVEVFQDK